MSAMVWSGIFPSLPSQTSKPVPVTFFYEIGKTAHQPSVSSVIGSVKMD
jgi:hypothetical protein